jgi:hypothetical protein
MTSKVLALKSLNAGIPATGKQVRLPYTAFYDLRGGLITSLRLYGLGGLVQQLQS